ncbi:cell division protein FtsL [Desulfohalotomaculum tongense]|uniref:hypothetical protein n=1 Tax=Desulforadius tongensis TaxID=1216062 RepID=UPI00195B2D65|nr:hypothetical protein [Desulforadius tongensis]MBM7855932.1 cell division protein FtsL [Desulforadius tongensis]
MVLAREKLDYNLPPEQPPERLPKAPGRKLPRRDPVRRKLALTFMVLCCFVMGVMVAFYYAQIAYVGYKIELLQHKLAELRLESHNLDQKVSKVVSMKHIEAIATSELGMVKPNSENVVPVSSASIVPDGGEQLPPGEQEKQLARRESITLPENPEPVPPNRFIQAFAEMVERWDS